MSTLEADPIDDNFILVAERVAERRRQLTELAQFIGPPASTEAIGYLEEEMPTDEHAPLTLLDANVEVSEQNNESPIREEPVPKNQINTLDTPAPEVPKTQKKQRKQKRPRGGMLKHHQDLTYEEQSRHWRIIIGAEEGSKGDSKEALLKTWLPWAVHFADSLATSNFPFDDCLQAALEGIAEAFDTFDPTYGGEIEPDSPILGKTYTTWIKKRMRGAILDAKRRADQFGPGHARTIGRLLRQEEDGIPLSEDEERLLSQNSVLNIDQEITYVGSRQGEEISLEDVLRSDEDTENLVLDTPEDKKVALESIIARVRTSLNEREKVAFDMLYRLDKQGSSQVEIAKVIGVTESRISQYNKKFKDLLSREARRQGFENPN